IQDLPPISEAAPPQAQPTIVSTKLTLHDLFTGGWKRPLTGLPTSLGRRRRAHSTAAPAHGWDEGSLYALREQAPLAPTAQAPPGRTPAYGKHRPGTERRLTEE